MGRKSSFYFSVIVQFHLIKLLANIILEFNSLLFMFKVEMTRTIQNKIVFEIVKLRRGSFIEKQHSLYELRCDGLL